ncbi:hypothetical protein C5167_031268 [Papaver somniferum]|uniref:uncharacterized protein LOC113333941 n=1 Tax=Papaver somniferum TaxID=3469 RepID=UPI000E6F7EB9|nr:uncharacterized protein LOC113333941 [Papaver somniferum]RZC88898.1 hypothetical protein C5167_031268 [Papaver somniferum]
MYFDRSGAWFMVLLASEILVVGHRKMEALRKKAEENGVVESLQQLDGDSYSQTIGPDKRGRYRGVGNCIKPKKRSRGECSSTSNTDDMIKDLQEHIVVIDQDREELRKVNEGLIKSSEETNTKMDKLLEIIKLISPNQDVAAMISAI